jgi:D-serine/D-alanine/glycine transporter
VVLTSAASSANSGIYSTSRMLYGLGKDGNAPARFGELSKRKVPQNALLFSCVWMTLALVMLYSGDSVMSAFVVVTSLGSVIIIATWTMIMVTYVVYRRRRPQLHEASSFKMPGSTYMPYVVLGFFALMLVALSLDAETRMGLYVAPLWFILLAVAWHFNSKKPRQQARIAAWNAMAAAEKQALTETATPTR